MNALKPKVKYLQKAFNAGNKIKINVGIEQIIIILSLKLGAVISLP